MSTQKPKRGSASELTHLLGCWVRCSAPGHDKENLYMLFELDEQRNGAKIQMPDEFKAHWVNARYVEAA